MLTLAEADAELQRLAVLRKNHTDEQYLSRRRLRDLPPDIERLGKRLADLGEDHQTIIDHARDPLVLDNRPYHGDEAQGALGRRLDMLPDEVRESKRIPLGRYRGLAFGLLLSPHGGAEVTLGGKLTRHGALARWPVGPRAVLNALDRLAESYPGQCEQTGQDLEIARTQLRGFEARIGRPFAHEGYVRQLTDLRDALKSALSQPTQDPAAVTSLAEQIKTLRSAHTVEATAERTPSHRLAGEQPVTARIRRRVEPEAAAVEEPPAEPVPVAVAPVTAELPAPPDKPDAATTGENQAQIVQFPAASPFTTSSGYRQKLARGRWTDERQLSLF